MWSQHCLLWFNVSEKTTISNINDGWTALNQSIYKVQLKGYSGGLLLLLSKYDIKAFHSHFSLRSPKLLLLEYFPLWFCDFCGLCLQLYCAINERLWFQQLTLLGHFLYLQIIPLLRGWLLKICLICLLLDFKVPRVSFAHDWQRKNQNLKFDWDHNLDKSVWMIFVWHPQPYFCFCK